MTPAEQYAQQLMASVEDTRKRVAELQVKSAAIEMKVDLIAAILDKMVTPESKGIMDGNEAADLIRGLVGLPERPKRKGRKKG